MAASLGRGVVWAVLVLCRVCGLHRFCAGSVGCGYSYHILLGGIMEEDFEGTGASRWSDPRKDTSLALFLGAGSRSAPRMDTSLALFLGAEVRSAPRMDTELALFLGVGSRSAPRMDTSLALFLGAGSRSAPRTDTSLALFLGVGSRSAPRTATSLALFLGAEGRSAPRRKQDHEFCSDSVDGSGIMTYSRIIEINLSAIER